MDKPLSNPGGTPPLFVVGAARSGTTLLRLHLLGHPRLVIPAESWFLLDLAERFPAQTRLDAAGLREALSYIENHPRWKDWRSSREPLDPALFGDSRTSLAEVVDTVFRRETKAGPDTIWGDKTPGYVSIVAWLAELFPKARFIHIVRDGRDVYLSLSRRGWQGDTPFQIGRYWRRCVRQVDSALSSLPESRKLRIRYEDLVLEPRREVERVCDFLGLEVQESMVQFRERALTELTEWELSQGFHSKLFRASRPEDVARWMHEGSPKLRMATGLMSRELRRHGYPQVPSPLVAQLWSVAAVLTYVTRPATWQRKVARLRARRA